MVKLPDISDLLKKIEKCNSLEEQLKKERSATMLEIRRRYEEAGIKEETCDHPDYLRRNQGSTNYCLACDKIF